MLNGEDDEACGHILLNWPQHIVLRRKK
jgi:hypothetical protein